MPVPLQLPSGLCKSGIGISLAISGALLSHTGQMQWYATEQQVSAVVAWHHAMSAGAVVPSMGCTTVRRFYI